MKNKLTTFVFCAIALLSYIPGVVRAESVVWSTAVEGHLCGSEPGYNSCYIDVSHPGVSISYNVQVSEVDASGATLRVLSSGDTVTKGAKVKFQFVPHTYQDISWFATGTWNDTPYGDWTANAAASGTQCLEKDMVSVWAWWVRIHIPLEVAPPAKNISGLSGLGSCTTLSDGVSVICNASTIGNYPVAFNFNATYGHFYGRFSESAYSYNTSDTNINNRPANDTWVCSGGYNTPMMITPNGGTRATGPAYTLQVPQQSIPFNLGVVDAAGNAPTAPSVSGNGACVVGTPYTIAMHSTTSGGAQVHYGIDWLNDGSITGWAPSDSLYVPSDTTLTASRTYTTAGNKSIRIMAQDDKGNSSGWTTFTFTCSSGASDTNTDTNAKVTSCPVGYTLAEGKCGFVGCPSGYTQSGSVCTKNACIDANVCQGNDVYHRDTACVMQFVQACPGGCLDGACLPALSADDGSNTIAVSIKATPSLVKPGDTSRISWNSRNATACSVLGSNSDSWTGLSGTHVSSPIFAQVIFTVTCSAEGLSAKNSVQVNIIPSYQER